MAEDRDFQNAFSNFVNSLALGNQGNYTHISRETSGPNVVDSDMTARNLLIFIATTLTNKEFGLKELRNELSQLRHMLEIIVGKQSGNTE
ncbi:MAG: hypothetical protein AB1497_12585 [Bacillota bacterium]